MANCVGGSLVAQQERKRVDENGFSGAGFAGQQVEAGGELNGNVVNDRVVFDPQFQQHVRSRLAEVMRSVARGNHQPCAVALRQISTAFFGAMPLAGQLAVVRPSAEE